MEKKFSIILIVAVALILLGSFLIISNPLSSDGNADSLVVPLKSHDFKLFEMEIPNGSDFSLKNEGDGMKYYQNNGNHSDDFSGIIINKNLTDSLIGINSVPLSNSSDENIYLFTLNNRTNYKYVSSHDGVDVILIGEDLNLLKEVSQTIKIKDVSDL